MELGLYTFGDIGTNPVTGETEEKHMQSTVRVPASANTHLYTLAIDMIGWTMVSEEALNKMEGGEHRWQSLAAFDMQSCKQSMKRIAYSSVLLYVWGIVHSPSSTSLLSCDHF